MSLAPFKKAWRDLCDVLVTFVGYNRKSIGFSAKFPLWRKREAIPIVRFTPNHYNLNQVYKQYQVEPSKPVYQSYMLRLWRPGRGEPWRAMLECVDSHERLGFADLEDLFAFLKMQTNRAGQPPEAATGGRVGGN